MVADLPRLSPKRFLKLLGATASGRKTASAAKVACSRRRFAKDRAASSTELYGSVFVTLLQPELALYDVKLASMLIRCISLVPDGRCLRSASALPHNGYRLPPCCLGNLLKTV